MPYDITFHLSPIGLLHLKKGSLKYMVELVAQGIRRKRVNVVPGKKVIGDDPNPLCHLLLEKRIFGLRCVSLRHSSKKQGLINKSQSQMYSWVT